MNTVSFQVWARLQAVEMTAKVKLAREAVQQSSVPASSSSFLATGAEAMPGPQGAGMGHTRTEPQQPLTLHGAFLSVPQVVSGQGQCESSAKVTASQLSVSNSWST